MDSSNSLGGGFLSALTEHLASLAGAVRMTRKRTTTAARHAIFIAASPSRLEIRKSNIEIRNKSENPNSEIRNKSERRNPQTPVTSPFRILIDSDFEFVSDFDI